MPCFTAEDEPGVHIGIGLFDHFQIGHKVFPGSGRAQVQLIKDLFVVKETGHGHVGAHTVLVAAGDVGAALPHGGDQSVPPFIHIGQIQVFSLVHIFLLVCSHDIRRLTGGKLDFNNVAGIVLILLLHSDAIALGIEIGDDFIDQIDSLHFTGEKCQVHISCLRRSGRTALTGGRCGLCRFRTTACKAGQNQAYCHKQRNTAFHFVPPFYKYFFRLPPWVILVLL